MDYKAILNSNKKVTEADKKFVETYFGAVLSKNSFDREIANPFTGDRTNTNCLVATLVEFIQNLSYQNFSPRTCQYYGIPEGQKIPLFFRARALVLKLDKDIYFSFID